MSQTRFHPTDLLTQDLDSSTYVGYQSSLICPFAKGKRSRNLLEAAASGTTQRVRMLLCRGADIDFKEKSEGHRGWTALHYAASGGFLNVVNALINAGCKLNAVSKDRYTALQLGIMHGHTVVALALSQADGISDPPGPQGMTALHLAATAGYAEVVRRLLQANADPNCVNDDDETPLYLAASAGHADVVSCLLNVPSIADLPNRYGKTALSEAISKGHVHIARTLVDSELGRVGDVNVMYEHDRPLLSFAVEIGSVDMVRVLLSAPGIKKDAVDILGYTTLHKAISLGFSKMTRLLIHHGCDINIHDKDVPTPLHIAVANGDVDTTKLLIEAHAKVDIAESDGNTPLHAAAAGDSRIVHLLLNARTHGDAMGSLRLTPLFAALSNLRLFVGVGGNVNHQGIDGESLIHLGILSGRGSQRIPKFFLKHGAKGRSQNADGNTPLHLAIGFPEPTESSALFEHARPGYIDIQNEAGETALHLAAYCGQLKNVQILIAAGADVRTQDNFGHTPLQKANMAHGRNPGDPYADIIKWLIEAECSDDWLTM